jgi:hypothetical protein
LFRIWQTATPAAPHIAAVLAAATVFIFAQSNVDMFSVQLKFLWALVALPSAGGSDNSNGVQGEDEDSLLRLPRTRSPCAPEADHGVPFRISGSLDVSSLGAGFETPNLGVSALASGALTES